MPLATSRASTSPLAPLSAAQCRALRFSLSRTWTFAPASSRALTVSADACPAIALWSSEVPVSGSKASASSPWPASRATIPVWSLATAHSNRLFPWKRICGSAPSLIADSTALESPLWSASVSSAFRSLAAGRAVPTDCSCVTWEGPGCVLPMTSRETAKPPRAQRMPKAIFSLSGNVCFLGN